MEHHLLFRGGSWLRAALLMLLVAAGLLAGPNTARASHLRAGDIQAKVDTTASPNPRRIFFKMVLYTDNSSSVTQPAATIFFGDGSSSCLDGVARASVRVLPNNPDTSVNIYYFEHIFPTTGPYTVSFIGENRNAGVLNMSNSSNQSFYISTEIYIDPALGLNRSPILTTPAVDKAGIGQVFLHNPGAYDADGDSLAFHLLASQQVPLGIAGTLGSPCPGTGNNRPARQPVPNFHFPNDPIITGSVAPQVAYNGIPTGVPGAPAIFVQDVRTGQITWNAPSAVGIYNIAFEVVEYRRLPAGRRLIGTVIRDMQIIVTATANVRPTLTIPPDICVVAGQTVTGTVRATDGSSPSSPATAVTLFAYSGIRPPATFVQTQTGPPQASGVFTWRTDCSNVARLPYSVVFKAQDNPANSSSSNPPLIDEQVWNITVVGPAPQNLRATPDATTGINRITLNWNTYTCANASTIYIYRKENSGPAPGTCITGIPASSGYVRVGSVPATATTFTDNNTSAGGVNQGFERGKNYCYRIYADFQLPAGGSSIASDEACAIFAGRGAMLTNVDVQTTSPTAGQIGVRWTQPRKGDGSPFVGTPSYVVTRAEGLNPAATDFVPVRTLTSLTDTSLVDTGLNTLDKQYTYKLSFVLSSAGAPVTETSPPASSVRVVAVPNLAGTQFTLSWTHNVPWDNAAQPTEVYRKLSTGTTYTRIGTATSTATGGSYVDSDASLVKGQRYCYYVRTAGRYAGFAFLSSLLNRSQEQCQALLSPPCTPVLTLAPTNCDSLANLAEFPRAGERYSNRLRWRLGNAPAGCDVAVSGYRVYYRARATGAFTLLGTTSGTSYEHRDLAFSGGCYAVQAVGASGVLSDTSNVACQDNCVFFKLPNIFTPNGDAQNAVFRPKNSSPLRSVHFQAFNRWGVKVFENTTTANDPTFINWSGGGPTSESANGNAARVADGVYFYLAEVEFADFANTRRTYKGWVEIIR